MTIHRGLLLPTDYFHIFILGIYVVITDLNKIVLVNFGKFLKDFDSFYHISSFRLLRTNEFLWITRSCY